MIRLFRSRPAPAAQPAPHVVALSDLNRRARKAVIAERRAQKLAELASDAAAGRGTPIAPREQVVAGVVRW